MNGIIMQYFEWEMGCNGQLWNNLKQRAQYLSDLGITAIWLPPAYKGAFGKYDVGYGVYDLYDLGEFKQKRTIRTKYGTKDEYLNCINELRKCNIDVYADIVLNHRMGADGYQEVPATKVDWNDRNKQIENKTIKAYTKFNFPGRMDKYSNFKWNWTHFDGIDYNYKNKEIAIYKFKDKNWGEDLDTEYGNYDYLMGADIDYGNETVIDQTYIWIMWYIDMTHINGLRLDAVKHIRASFFDKLIKYLRETKNMELFTVGEYWSSNINDLNKYIDQTHGQISLFDVPLHYNLFNASNDRSYDLRNIYDNTLTKRFPYLSVTFVDNHDTQPKQSLQSFIAEDFKQIAYAIILLRTEGYPCVFYGDFYSIPTSNIKKTKDLDKLISTRKNYLANNQKDYFIDNNLIAWSNLDYDNNKSLVVVINRSYEKRYVDIQLDDKYIGKKFKDILNNCDDIVDVKNINENFFANPNSVSVYTLM